MNFRFPVCSTLSGNRVDTAVIIFDCQGVTMSTIDSNCYKLIKFGSQIGSDYYPESMGLFFVVNAPTIFPLFWSIIKGWLNEKTRNRIKILGTNYKDELL
jgi:hypothetical protein